MFHVKLNATTENAKLSRIHAKQSWNAGEVMFRIHYRLFVRLFCHLHFSSGDRNSTTHHVRADLLDRTVDACTRLAGILAEFGRCEVNELATEADVGRR